jgi:hypothetical protein
VTLYRKCSEALTFENVWQGQRALRLESARRAVLGLLKAHLSASFDHFIYNVRISRQARERAEQALHRMRIAEIAAAFNEFARVLLEQWEHRVAVRAALPHGLRLTYCGRALDLWRNAILNAHTKRVHRSKIPESSCKKCDARLAGSRKACRSNPPGRHSSLPALGKDEVRQGVC